MKKIIIQGRDPVHNDANDANQAIGKEEDSEVAREETHVCVHSI